VSTAYDFSPGAQIPRTDIPLQTAVTASLCTGAYRDAELTDASVAAGMTVKPGRMALFRPNLGEAFTRAVIKRTLSAGRKPLVPAFGTDPRLVVEHCLEADALRRDRDRRLTVVMALCGLLFLPGTLMWMLAFQLRAMLAPRSKGREDAVSAVVFLVIGAFAVWFLVFPPVGGFWGFYLRIMMLVPILGWYLARRICLRSAQQLRDRWSALAGGAVVGPTVPAAVPAGPEDTKAEALRAQIAGLLAEQETNILHYAGTKGVLGLGRRWGVWQLAEELRPKEGVDEVRAFRAWDVARKIADRLNDLKRDVIPNSGIPHPIVRHWVVFPVGEGADELSRPTGPEMDGPRMRDVNVQEICNNQTFGRGPRHYLGVQFVLWEGQSVITLMVTVTALHRTLRIEVTGHALGPIDGVFSGGPKARTRSVAKRGRFWESREVTLPLLDNDEVVRLAARAPFTRFPDVLDWLGGGITMPEPFGLRSTWTGPIWTHRFMADDALRVATPVLRAVHAAAREFLEEQDVDLTRFDARAAGLSGEVQGVRPSRVDAYDA